MQTASPRATILLLFKSRKLSPFPPLPSPPPACFSTGRHSKEGPPHLKGQTCIDYSNIGFHCHFLVSNIRTNSGTQLAARSGLTRHYSFTRSHCLRSTKLSHPYKYSLNPKSILSSHCPLPPARLR
ncbi:hypothetical protein L596_004987 [Steinernema carpocapsae]|uniref:Uncharacterized protein n=1 Tax=Steinernema carpocapsae TaxID=34508 RepID=A0A4U8V150_STECR|nr:hypothetical protein L596_004987 [Steinernema carpocapsae]